MMKLRGSATSPYVRKVRALAIELGLDDRVELVLTDPWATETDLTGDNPLSKVPTLITEDHGQPLYDSRVICEYLDAQHGGRKFFPDGEARWTALRLQALGDGICDAAIARLQDTRRPQEQQSAGWQTRQRNAVARACDLLESEAASLDGPLTIGGLAVAAALLYLDLRGGHEDWRAGRPRLQAWLDGIARRPSITATAPPAA